MRVIIPLLTGLLGVRLIVFARSVQEFRKSIDFLAIPESKQIELNEAITNASTRFKLTVVNGSLSPGITLELVYEKDGTLYKTNKVVEDYDDMALSDLETFSFGGVSGTSRLVSVKFKMTRDIIYEAGLLPSNTGDVKGNELGKDGEWRNGALTLQAVTVNADGSDGFTTEPALSNGGQGAATSGLLWEAAIFWHWGGDSYHEDDNKYIPRNFNSIKDEVE